MKDFLQSNWKKNSYVIVGKTVVLAVMFIQLFLVFLSQTLVIINTDGIFSYTLANNPYNYTFISGMYNEFPNSNGWIDAHILKENYVVEKYDRFNYSAVYYHQRNDVHPPLYYFFVHTFSSLFAGTYSNLYVMAVNLVALFFIDLLMIRWFHIFYGKSEYSVIPFSFLILMNIMKFLYTWPRMYMLLFLFCAWYLYIHGRLINEEKWRKSYLVQMVCCIFLGTLTHYYFYVYAALLSLFSIVFFIRKRGMYKVFNYVYSGIIGLVLSWIFYPWVMWHIFDNPQDKHTDITPWSLEKLRQYFVFINEKLFNGRVWVAGLILLILWLWVLISGGWKTKNVDAAQRSFRRIILGSGILYSLIIYTLDKGGALSYYSTPFYTAFIVWFSMALLDLVKRIKVFWKRDALVIVTAVVCVTALYSTSVLKTYVTNAGFVISRVLSHESLRDGIFKVSEDYQQYDCIFIEQTADGLFQGYWFEFGGYDEFKKITVEDFEQYGISEETLNGRHTDDGIILYAPKEYIFDESSYKLLASDIAYNIFEIIGGED